MRPQSHWPRLSATLINRLIGVVAAAGITGFVLGMTLRSPAFASQGAPCPITDPDCGLLNSGLTGGGVTNGGGLIDGGVTVGGRTGGGDGGLVDSGLTDGGLVDTGLTTDGSTDGSSTDGTSTSHCGDGICDGSETPLKCPVDCLVNTLPVCGDSVCDPLETAATCPTDCDPKVVPVCGDDVCSALETITGCPQDCAPDDRCGDGVCGLLEDSTTCSADCRPAATILPNIPTSTPRIAPTAVPQTTDQPQNTTAPPTATVVPLTPTVTEEPTRPVVTTTPTDTPIPESVLAALPGGCRLVPVAEIPQTVASGLADLERQVTGIEDTALICDTPPPTVCVPSGGLDQRDAQIVGCTAGGRCQVYTVTDVHVLSEADELSAICVTRKLARQIPACAGACIAARGLKVTAVDASGVVLPITTLLTVLIVGFTFLLARRRRSLEIGEEHSLALGELVTTQQSSVSINDQAAPDRIIVPAYDPTARNLHDDADRGEDPGTIQLNSPRWG